jgi:hypothetical protein
MHTTMKTKYVYVTTAILCVFVVLVIFKLNSYYKSEKMQAVQIQLNQQNGGLKTSISTQLGQLKNILSSYSYHVEESKINWMQLDPLMVIAQTHVFKNGSLSVKNIFTKSGTRAESWKKEYLQKALSLNKHSGKSIHAELFRSRFGDKYLAMTFANGPASGSNGFDAVTVVGDASYFQKFFDLNRSKKTTHVLMTDSSTVAGHNQADYIASKTTEGSLKRSKYFTETEELRSSNLKIISYALKSSTVTLFNIPFMLLGMILGFFCIFIGILFYAFGPIDKTIRSQKKAERELLYQNAMRDTVKSMQSEAVSSEVQNIDLKKLKMKPVHVELPKSELEESAQQTLLITVAPTVQVVPPQPVSTFEGAAFVQPTDGKIDIGRPLSVALSALKSRCVELGINLNTEISTQNKFEFEDIRFQKMFDLILKNAIEAIQLAKASGPKIISVRCYDKDFSTVVEIQDSGIGILTENLEKIWQPYYTTKNKNEHLGLGLSEALSVAKRYGGDLSVSQNAGGGTVFKLIMNGLNMDHKVEVPTDIRGPDVHAVTENFDIDLDQILDLDSAADIDDTVVLEAASEKPPLNLEKEFSTTQFKMDRHAEILEDPQIEFKKNERPLDQFKVHIRGSRKS